MQSKSKQLPGGAALSWLVLTGLCTALAALVVYFWALDNHDQSDLDTVNDLGQAYAVLIGLILSVYLERSVEKRRRVALAHENKNEAEKRANDKEAIPNAFTALVFAIILILLEHHLSPAAAGYGFLRRVSVPRGAQGDLGQRGLCGGR